MNATTSLGICDCLAKKCDINRCLVDGQFCNHCICLFAYGKDLDVFKILAIVQSSSVTLPTTSFVTIREAELLLGKSINNLAMVDTSVKINMNIQHSRGLAISANLAFLCQLSTAVQCNHNKNYLVSFLYKAPMLLNDGISENFLLDIVEDKQAELLSLAVIVCVDNILDQPCLIPIKSCFQSRQGQPHHCGFSHGQDQT